MPTDALRVLHLSTWKVPCGIAGHCGELVKALQAAGVENEVHPLRPEEWMWRHDGDVDRWFEEVAAHARGFDVVHVQHEHSFFGQERGWRFALTQFSHLLKTMKAQRTPVVTTFHTEPGAGGGPRKASWLRNLLTRLQWRRMWGNQVFGNFGPKPGQAQAIVHSMHTRKTFLKMGAPVEAFHVMPICCRPQRAAAAAPAAARQELGVPPGVRLLTMFGFLGRYKGHDLAIESLHHLPEDVHLAIVGGPHPSASDDYMEQLLRQLNAGSKGPRDSRPAASRDSGRRRQLHDGPVARGSLASRVKITGYVSEATAAQWFAAADLCLAPYRPAANLSGSAAVTWALSSGKPTIAAKIEAFQSIQRERECFYMVSPDSPRELAWAVEKVLADEELRNRITANAAAYCEAHSWDAGAARTIGVYERLLGRSSSAAGFSGPPHTSPAGRPARSRVA